MNFIKATIATAAVITCCMGNEMPAKAKPWSHDHLHGLGFRHDHLQWPRRHVSTIFDMRPKPLDFGGSTITPPSNDMIMCNTMGSNDDLLLMAAS